MAAAAVTTVGMVVVVLLPTGLPVVVGTVAVGWLVVMMVLMLGDMVGLELGLELELELGGVYS